MSQKRLNIIAVMVLLASMASACVRGTGFRPDVYVSPTSSDSNDCWTATNACATVDRALSRLSDLGEVHFAAGEYPLAGSISDLHGLTTVIFRGEGSATTTLFSPPGGGAVLSFSTPALVEIYDLAFDGRDTPSETSVGSTGILMGTDTILRIQDCLFNGLRYGIENINGMLFVHGSRFTNNDLAISNRNQTSASTTIDGSQFRANSYAIKHLIGRMKISGSTFADNGLPILGGSNTTTVQNEDRMSISDSTFVGDLFSDIVNLKDGVLDLTNVYISGGEGNGIENYGTLTADYLTITEKPGGGFLNAIDPEITSSVAQLTNAVISGNGSYGIKNQHLLTLSDSVVQGNDGDGLVNEFALLSIFHSAIVGNHGRGIYARASTHVEDSTISGNEQEGIYFIGTGFHLLSLEFATVADNAGGGIVSDSPSGTYVMLMNSIIALNPGGSGNCTGEAEWFFGGFDLACNDLDTLTYLGLGPLTHIGDTWVHPLLAGSPAIDRAFIHTGFHCPSRDQTGTARPQPVGGRCDIGAFELAGTTLSGEIPLPPPPTALPIFTFIQQANCRKGPNSLYESIGIGQIGQQVQIEGLSDPAGWYYVLLPDAVNRCFVAGSTGDVTGPVDELPIIPVLPLLVAPFAPELGVSNQICDATKYIVRLSWKDVEDEDGYRVYRDGVLIASLGADSSVFDDSSPDYGSQSYQVEAFNDSGSTGSTVKASEGCVY